MGMNGMRGGMGDLASYAAERKKSGRKNDPQTLRRIAKSFRPYKIQVVLVLIAILTTTILGLVNPLMIRLVFDEGIAKRDFTRLLLFCGIMFITPVISGIVGVGQTYMNNLIGQNVMRDFRNNLYNHLQQMSLRFFSSTRTGEIQSRLSNDVSGVQNVVTETGTSIVSNLSTTISTIIAMLIISPLLTLVSLCLMPIFLWITYRVGNVRRVTSKQTQQSLASLTAMMQETLSVSGILLTKTYGRQQYASNRFEKENQNLTDLEIRQQMTGRWFFMLIGTFFSILPPVVYLIAGWQIILRGGGLTFGDIVAFTTLQSRLFFPIGQLLSIQVQIQGALALFDRIFEYLDLPIEIKDRAKALQLKPEQVKGDISFDHVTFSYRKGEAEEEQRMQQIEEKAEIRENGNDRTPTLANGKSQPTEAALTALKPLNTSEEEGHRITLSDISFEIKPGQLAALVGPSGAGKTTITYMVPRLYDVNAGSVKIDNYDVRDIALSSLGEIIGMVTQETYLFHASVRENLLYARPEATDDEMIAAAKAAAIHERILELDDGYDTIVGERGYKLSGGEKQRIAIARVILKNPRVLILDEATSALDTHSERLIQAALEPLMKDRTTIAIAHRLSTILAADIILVVDHGEIVERGTHTELLARNGLYARLYNEQFSSGQVKVQI